MALGDIDRSVVYTQTHRSPIRPKRFMPGVPDLFWGEALTKGGHLIQWRNSFQVAGIDGGREAIVAALEAQGIEVSEEDRVGVKTRKQTNATQPRVERGKTNSGTPPSKIEVSES